MPVRIFPASHSGTWLGWAAGRYPGGLGHLYSPGDFRGPFPFLPYALDNGRFSAAPKPSQLSLSGDQPRRTPWERDRFVHHLERAASEQQKPLWVVVPDVVGEPEDTLRQWDEWASVVAEFGFPLAFAAQDGHNPSDVPDEADIVFIGGSLAWKLRVVPRFCEAFPRVHVGRINTREQLQFCHDCGVESIDGSGWFRNQDTDRSQRKALLAYLHEHYNSQVAADR